MYNLFYKSLLPQQVMSPASTKSHRTFFIQKDQKLQNSQATSGAKLEEKNGKKKKDMRPIKPKKAPTPEDLIPSKRQIVVKQKFSAHISLISLYTRLPPFLPFFSIFYLLSIYYVRPIKRTRKS